MSASPRRSGGLISVPAVSLKLPSMPRSGAVSIGLAAAAGWPRAGRARRGGGAADLVEVEHARLEVGRDVGPARQGGLDRALERLAVQHDAALVGGRLGRALGRAGQRQGAVRLQALAHAVHRELAEAELLEAAGDAAARRHGAQTGRRRAQELQHAIHVGRLEVEGDVGARLGRRITPYRAAHGEPRAGEVGHRDVVQPQGAAAQGDVDSDAADRLLAPDQLGHLGFQPERGARHRRDGCRRRSNRRGRSLSGRRRHQEGIEVERVELDLRHDRQRLGEGHHDAAAALEVVELEDGVAHLHVAAVRRHPALHGEPRELVGRQRRDVDLEPGQRLAQPGSDEAELAGDRGPRRIAREGRAGLQHHVARQGGAELGHGDGAALRLELDHHVADRLPVVDDLADVERQLGGHAGEQAGAGGWRGGGRRSGRRRHRRLGLRRAGDRGQPAIEIELGGRELALDGARGLQGQGQRAREAVLAQRQLEVLGRYGGLRDVDAAVEAEPAGEQRRQLGLGLAGDPDQGVDEGDQIVGRARGQADGARVRSKLAQGALEGELAAARLERDLGGVARRQSWRRPKGRASAARR